MERKIIMNLAMSLDGFIADENGAYDWIKGDDNILLNTSNKWDFGSFLEDIDTVIMGKACYEQNMHADFPDKKVFVATNSDLKNHDNIYFIKGDICEVILNE